MAPSDDNAPNPDSGDTIDWDKLKEWAGEAMSRAYAPYSNFAVGAAGMVDDGRTVVGANVENASYGLSLCAECSLVSDLVRTGGGRLIAVAIVSGTGQPCMPCGRCRQLLHEHGGANCLVDGDGTARTLGELLPGAFDADRITADGDAHPS